MSKAFYFAVELSFWHQTSNLEDGQETPDHKYSVHQRLSLGSTGKIDLDISPVHPLMFTGVKSAKFGLDFPLPSLLLALWFQNETK